MGGAAIGSAGCVEVPRLCNLFCYDSALNLLWAYTSPAITDGTQFPIINTHGLQKPAYNATLNRVQAFTENITNQSITNSAAYEKNHSSFLVPPYSPDYYLPSVASILNDDGSVISLGQAPVSGDPPPAGNFFTLTKFNSAGTYVAGFSASGFDSPGLPPLARLVGNGTGWIAATAGQILFFNSSFAMTPAAANIGTYLSTTLNDFEKTASNIFIATNAAGGGFTNKNAFKLDSSGDYVSGVTLGTAGNAVSRVVEATDGSLYWSTPTTIYRTDASLSVLGSISVNSRIIAPAPSGGVYVGINNHTAGLDNLFHYDSSGSLVASTILPLYPGSSTVNATIIDITSSPDGSRLFVGGVSRYPRWQSIPV